MRLIPWKTRTAPTIAGLTLLCVVSGCGGGSGESRSTGQGTGYYNREAGISAVIPASWHRVGLEGLAGADVALQVASFRPRGAVRTICFPHRIVNQIPAGGALVQILEDTGGVPKFRESFPQRPRPFRLGPPRAYECGGAYNIFFRDRGRGFQVRVWSAPTGLSESVRHQIEGLLDSLWVQSRAVAVREAVKYQRLPIANSASPFIGLDCPKANAFHCDRVYFFFALTQPAEWLRATVGGRPVRDIRPSRLAAGSTSGSAKKGFSWAGLIQPAGLMSRGAPLHIGARPGDELWGGIPSVRANVRVTAGFSSGRTISELYRNVPLRAGHG